MHDTPQEFSALVGELDAGVFEQKISAALAEVAMGTMATRKKGKITIHFDLKPIGDSNQVDVTHRLAYVRPTAKGKVTEENTTSTPLYVSQRGRLSIFPENQQRLPLAEREEA